MKKLFGVLLALMFLVTAVRAQTAPVIASISSSQQLSQGQSATLKVSVNGTLPFTYQWYKDGTEITGATTNYYSIASALPADTGAYTVKVTNTVGSVTSSAVLISVTAATAPYFNYQPNNVSYTAGSSTSLYVSVSGTSPITYVWKNGDTVVSTQTNYPYLDFSNLQVSNSGTYTVTVSNVAGSATSSSFTVTVSAPTAPTISSNPSNQTVSVGASFSFYAYVTSHGGGTISYQWYKDGMAIAGATSYNYSKSAATLDDAGSYTMKATDSAGSVETTAAKLTVTAPTAPSNVTITTGPLTVNPGDSLYMYSSVGTGTSPFTYQWCKDGQPIAGATSYYYSRYNFASADVGVYTLVVSNASGSASSPGTMVGIRKVQTPIITSNPASMTVQPGSYVSLSVSAYGVGSLNYQWQKDGVAIVGATSSYYSVTSNATSANAGAYTVVVSNAAGSVTSTAGTLTVLSGTAPTISSQPQDITVLRGQSFTLNVGASGYPAPTYQWMKDGVAIANGTSSSFSTSSVASSDSGVYTVAVSNSVGSVTSRSVTVTVSDPTLPTIVSQPSSASILLGNSYYSLSVSLAKYQSDTYQWYKNGTAISGATSSTYYIYSAQSSDAGAYHVVVTNGAGSTTSNDSTITVDLASTQPVIIFTSGDRAVIGGGTGSLSIGIKSTLTGYTVAWTKDDVTIPNAGSTSLNVSSFGATNEGTYVAQVTVGGLLYSSAPMKMTLLNKGVAPVITANPGSANVLAGRSVTFSASADGEAPMTYQWKKEGTAISGATSYSYTISNTTAANAGSYTVTATNANGSSTSTAATLTVTAAPGATIPVISSQPISQTMLLGGSSSTTLSLSVGVMSNVDSNYSYQWYKDGIAIANATSSYYYGYSFTKANAGTYTVKVTNSAGSVTSDGAVITVATTPMPPSFTTQPIDQSGYTGGTATFTAAATGASAVSYQWRKDGTDIAGATSTTFTLTNLQEADAALYTVVASDDEGTISSTGATLAITPSVLPTFTKQPASKQTVVTATITLSVTATGTPDPTYQWTKNGTNIDGATGTTLTFDSIGLADAGNYAVIVTNYAGSVTSDTATVSVYTQAPSVPSFTTQPESQTHGPGEQVSFSVAAAGFPVPTLQWYKDGTAIAGETSSTLTLGSMTEAMAGDYYAIATNDQGTAQSTTATLTYTPSPYAGTYFGTLSTGESWALCVNADATATYLALSSAGKQLAFANNFQVDPSGSFSFTYNGAGAIPTLPTTVYASGAVTGQIAAGKVTGQITGTSNTLTGDVVTDTGDASALAGVYQTLNTGSEASELHAIVSTNGDVLAVETDAAGARGGRGTIKADGTFTVQTPDFVCTGSIVGGTIMVTDSSVPVIGSQPSDAIAAVGGSAKFAVVASGVPAPSYQWQKDGIAIDGATSDILALNSLDHEAAGSYSVTITNLAGSVTSAAAKLTIYDQLPAAPTITTQPTSKVYTPGETVTLSAAATGYPAPTLQWYKDGVALEGMTDGTITVGKISDSLVGSYYAVASNAFGTAQTDTVAVGSGPSPYAGVYFGTDNGDSGHWALTVNADGTGTFLAYLPGRQSAIKVDVVVAPDGTFSVTGTEIVPASAGQGPTSQSVGSGKLARRAAAAGTFTLSGQISGSSVSAQLPEFSLELTGSADTSGTSGTTQIYTASALGATAGTTYAIVAPSGQAVVVTTTGSEVDGAAGTVDGGGNLIATTGSGGQLSLTINAGSDSITASLTAAGSSTPVTFAGLGTTAQPWNRLVNLSSRAMSGTGNNVAIGGFVISGTGTKKLLVRAVGPTLATEGLSASETLADPTIVLHDVLHGGNVIATVDNWGDGTDAADITALAAQLGAAPLDGSDAKSAAAILNLPAGVYSFVAGGKNSTTGIELVEVYDADASDSTTTLVNMSTRSYCATGDSVTIGGFVVTGNSPKTVLVRAVGPTLATQGLGANEVLADPMVDVHDVLHGNVVIATNDNWGDNADAAQIVTTGARVGATPLAGSDTTSSALLLTLQKGVYSFVVHGKNNGAGIVLIEVYDAN